ncbi:hypothetical protein BGX34_004436 [Mortierella sp. NVP85]|nr:hypothetical protein BGX34_004436 [Mortierella sp. NVP85]
MFSVLSWIRPSDAQANDVSKTLDDANVPVSAASSPGAEEQHQEDWVFLPSDHNDLMESSISDLDLLSASMTLYRPSTHPASSRTRSGHDPALTTSTEAEQVAVVPQQKSRRQLKQERRQQQALAELERKPRYDPVIAKMRDQEFKMAKMAKLGLRSGITSSPVGGGTSSARGARGASNHNGSGSNATTSGPQPSAAL